MVRLIDIRLCLSKNICICVCVCVRQSLCVCLCVIKVICTHTNTHTHSPTRTHALMFVFHVTQASRLATAPYSLTKLARASPSQWHLVDAEGQTLGRMASRICA
jgi:hypothetical protein